MGISRSTDPTTWDDVDGVIINESAPTPNMVGVPADLAILVGQFERGDVELEEYGSIGELHEALGKSITYSGNIALMNKKFSRLKVIRALAAAAVKASLTAESAGAVDLLTFTAKWKGAYGNSLKVTIAAGTTTGKKYTFQDTSANAVLPDEVYDDVVITAITASTFSASKLIDVAVIATSAEPANIAATPLASGADGSIADTDYQTAIAKAEVEGAGNILFLDAYNATRNGYLKQHAADTQDKLVILAGLEADTRAQAVTDAANYRDAEGFIIYAFPWVKTVINGASTYVQPASFYASLLSQTAPNIDPAYSANTQFLSGITGLKLVLKKSDYVALMAAGISAFEFDADIGYKIKSGVVTQISNSSKIMVFRRRMASYLTATAARYAKAYQNGPNSKENRTAFKGGLLAFIQAAEQDKLLPKDSDVKSGLAKLVDTESANTDNSIAAGFFKVIWKQRIFSSMRFIVIQAEIGESVVVTEGE